MLLLAYKNFHLAVNHKLSDLIKPKTLVKLIDMQPAISFSAYLLTLPAQFIRWWFIEATFTLLEIMRYFLAAFYQILGVRSLFRTFFKPWKNEYREGLVKFSLFMGMFIKSILLVFDALFFIVLIGVEFVVLCIWFFFPLLVIWGIYAAIFT